MFSEFFQHHFAINGQILGGDLCVSPQRAHTQVRPYIDFVPF